MGGSAAHRIDPAVDRAAALIRDLDSHKSEEPQVAEPMERLIARLIDFVIWLGIVFAWSIAGFYVDVWFFEDPLRQVNSPNGVALARIEGMDPLVGWTTSMLAMLTILAFEVIPTARAGRGWAKRKLRLRVVGPDGGPPGYWRALSRWAIWWLPAIVGVTLWGPTFGTPWGFAAIALQTVPLAIPGWMFRSESHRGLHDIAAGTRVLSDR